MKQLIFSKLSLMTAAAVLMLGALATTADAGERRGGGTGLGVGVGVGVANSASYSSSGAYSGSSSKARGGSASAGTGDTLVLPGSTSISTGERGITTTTLWIFGHARTEKCYAKALDVITVMANAGTPYTKAEANALIVSKCGSGIDYSSKPSTTMSTRSVQPEAAPVARQYQPMWAKTKNGKRFYMKHQAQLVAYHDCNRGTRTSVAPGLQKAPACGS